MSIEDTFNGTKIAFIFFYEYFNAVAQEIGMERALALESKASEAMGVKTGKMIKEQAGVEELDAKAAASLARKFSEGIGGIAEVIEESPQKAVIKYGRCPIYEAAKEMGLDSETIEAGCRAGGLRFNDAMVKQLNPNLSYQLRKFRSAADDFCEEMIVLG